MAKRAAEALACCAPWENFFSLAPLAKRSRSDSERRELQCATLRSGGGCKKRKRAEEEAEEVEAVKRPVALKENNPREEAGLGLRATALEGTKPPLPAEAASGGGLEGYRSPKPPQIKEDEDVIWHYNSFQYWRPPLPAIDLSDILDLEKHATVESRDSSNTGLSEMET